MNRQANVSSIDSLRLFRAALQEYAETVQDAIGSLQSEAQRAVDWFEQDRMSYWPAEVRRASDNLIEVRNRLEMKQLTIDPADTPSCFEEKKAVEHAKRRLRYAEEKVQKTHHWLRIVRHEMDEFRGMLAKLGQLPEADLPRAAAVMGRMTEALTGTPAHHVIRRETRPRSRVNLLFQKERSWIVSICDLLSGTGRLNKATRELAQKWALTRDDWNDKSRHDFEELHLQPIGPKVRLLLATASELNELLQKAERDCRDENHTEW